MVANKTADNMFWLTSGHPGLNQTHLNETAPNTQKIATIFTKLKFFHLSANFATIVYSTEV